MDNITTSYIGIINDPNNFIIVWLFLILISFVIYIALRTMSGSYSNSLYNKHYTYLKTPEKLPLGLLVKYGIKHKKGKYYRGKTLLTSKQKGYWYKKYINQIHGSLSNGYSCKTIDLVKQPEVKT